MPWSVNYVFSTSAPRMLGVQLLAGQESTLVAHLELQYCHLLGSTTAEFVGLVVICCWSCASSAESHSCLCSMCQRLDRDQVVHLRALLGSLCFQRPSWLSLLPIDQVQNLGWPHSSDLQGQLLPSSLRSLQPQLLSYVPPASMSYD